jgi:serine protease Do
MRRAAASLAIVFAAHGGASAQQSLESAFRTTGPQVVAAFEEQRAVLQQSSAVIQQGRTQLAYGTVVSVDGAVLTKASEIEDADSLTVVIDRRVFRNVEVAAVDPVWDVALLRVDADDLTPVVFADESAAEPGLGTWVVANGATSRTTRRALAGVISANARAIATDGGAVLGVMLKAVDQGLEIESTVEGSGAERAGLQVGDIITEVAGQPVAAPEDVVEAIGEGKPGERIAIAYLRDGDPESAEVPLTARGQLFNEEMMTRNDMMSGDFSRRRSGFPRVIQHDILGNSSTVGGPLIGLDGRCVGMNIARANRSESFAIPAAELRDVIARLNNADP